MGRSDVFLRLEIIKKVYGIALLIFALICFDSPIAIVAMGLIATLIGFFVNASPNKKLIGYSYFEQIRDVLPSFIIAILMFVCVSALTLLSLSPIILILVQIATGIFFYVLVSVIFKPEPYKLLINIIKQKFKKRK